MIMGALRSALKSALEFPPPDPAVHSSQEETLLHALTAELHAARAREAEFVREKRDLSQRHVLLAYEFEHRLINGLQLIVSLLSLQSRIATPEAAAQLNIAARRVSALGRVHHRLHLLDHQNGVEFDQYLRQLCDDLSRLLFGDSADFAIVVEATRADIATEFAIPLGFIINELITNAAKYGGGNITVRFQPNSSGHSLSVSDNGPGLPQGFDPANSKGLGMKIVQSLVKQISGDLQFAAGDDGMGACFTVTFCSRETVPISPNLPQANQAAVCRAEWDRVGYPSHW
jgi:two-component sensor histidine kinase